MAQCIAIFLERSVTHSILAVAATIVRPHKKHASQVSERENPPIYLEELYHLVHFDLRNKPRNHGSSLVS